MIAHNFKSKFGDVVRLGSVSMQNSDVSETFFTYHKVNKTGVLLYGSLKHT